MRKAIVLYKNEPAGELTQFDDSKFEFQYFKNWVDRSDKPAISLTLPKQIEAFCSDYLFPFFYNMLPEGSNKESICFQMRIDKTDYFGLLLTIAKKDTIGAVSLEKIQ